MDNYFYATDVVKEAFRWNDTSELVFAKILYRLWDLSITHAIANPNYLRENAWHLSTLLNTFNAYYCYDVTPFNDKAEIQPIFVRFGTETEIRRLLSIELLLGERGEDDDIVLHFDDTINRILRVSAFAFSGAEDYTVVSSSSTDEIGRYTEKPPIDKALVRYSTDDTTVIEIMPFRCDILTTQVNTVTINGVFRDLIIDRRYVADARIVKTGMYRCSGPANYRTNGIKDTVIKETLYAYIYGADIGYLNANFDETGTYSPKSRIAWQVSDGDPIFAQLLEYSKISVPTGDQLKLAVYQEDDYVHTIERAVFDHTVAIDLLTEQVDHCLAYITRQPVSSHHTKTLNKKKKNTTYRQHNSDVTRRKLEWTLKYLQKAVLYTEMVITKVLLQIGRNDDPPIETENSPPYPTIITRRSLKDDTFIRASGTSGPFIT